MSEVKITKKRNLLTTLLVFAFVFVRAILLTNRRYIGIENFYTLSLNYESREITLLVLF